MVSGGWGGGDLRQDTRIHSSTFLCFFLLFWGVGDLRQDNRAHEQRQAFCVGGGGLAGCAKRRDRLTSQASEMRLERGQTKARKNPDNPKNPELFLKKKIAAIFYRVGNRNRDWSCNRCACGALRTEPTTELHLSWGMRLPCKHGLKPIAKTLRNSSVLVS